MNQNDNKFIKEVIASDLKKISNPDFTLSTLERIKESKKEKSLDAANRIDLTLLYPVLGFSFLFILFSITQVIGSWIETETFDKILRLTGLISGLLFHPMMISLMTVFALLHLLDSYLKKQDTKFPKANTQYT